MKYTGSNAMMSAEEYYNGAQIKLFLISLKSNNWTSILNTFVPVYRHAGAPKWTSAEMISLFLILPYARYFIQIVLLRSIRRQLYGYLIEKASSSILSQWKIKYGYHERQRTRSVLHGEEDLLWNRFPTVLVSTSCANIQLPNCMSGIR
jgi:hypothetical protein